MLSYLVMILNMEWRAAIMWIKKFLKNAFPKAFTYYREKRLLRQAYEILIKNKESFLYLTGWMNSLSEGKPVDVTGNQIPWMNYQIVTLLENRLRSDFHLFEFGSGFSTVFYASLVKSVTSVECNQNWFQKIRKTIPENVELVFKNKDIDGQYCRVISEAQKEFDVVIVDGRDRVNCIKQAIEALSPRGVILLDDSQRKRYQEGISYAKERGFRALSIEGFKATGLELDETTILYRNENCFDI